jgi:hypothetical protein
MKSPSIVATNIGTQPYYYLGVKKEPLHRGILECHVVLSDESYREAVLEEFGRFESACVEGRRFDLSLVIEDEPVEREEMVGIWGDGNSPTEGDEKLAEYITSEVGATEQTEVVEIHDLVEACIDAGAWCIEFGRQHYYKNEIWLYIRGVPLNATGTPEICSDSTLVAVAGEFLPFSVYPKDEYVGNPDVRPSPDIIADPNKPPEQKGWHPLVYLEQGADERYDAEPAQEGIERIRAIVEAGESHADFLGMNDYHD